MQDQVEVQAKACGTRCEGRRRVDNRRGKNKSNEFFHTIESRIILFVTSNCSWSSYMHWWSSTQLYRHSGAKLGRNWARAASTGLRSGLSWVGCRRPVTENGIRWDREIWKAVTSHQQKMLWFDSVWQSGGTRGWVCGSVWRKKWTGALGRLRVGGKCWRWGTMGSVNKVNVSTKYTDGKREFHFHKVFMHVREKCNNDSTSYLI